MNRLVFLALFLFVVLLAGCGGGNTLTDSLGDPPVIAEKETSNIYNVTIPLPTYNFFPVTATTTVDENYCQLLWVHYQLYYSDGTTPVPGWSYWSYYPDDDCPWTLSGSGLSQAWYVLKATADGIPSGSQTWTTLGTAQIYIAKLD